MPSSSEPDVSSRVTVANGLASGEGCMFVEFEELLLLDGEYEGRLFLLASGARRSAPVNYANLGRLCLLRLLINVSRTAVGPNSESA